MQTIVVSLGEQIAQGRKSAILTPVTPTDRYQDSGVWHTVTDAAWQHNHPVQAVNHFGQHQHTVGEVIAVRALETMHIVCEVQIILIRMVDCAALTDAEIAVLGYPSRTAWLHEWGDILHNRRAWWMDIAI